MPPTVPANKAVTRYVQRIKEERRAFLQAERGFPMCQCELRHLFSDI
jgi:hypothetical protein